MARRNHFIIVCVYIVLTSCGSVNENAKIEFGVVNDSLFKPNDIYIHDLNEWKKYYGNCMNEQLFQNAFYFELHNQLGIGTINNQHALQVNKEINILDTSNDRNIYNLLSTVSTSNCSDTFSLNDHLKKTFYNEVANVLHNTAEYKNFQKLADTSKMKIRIGTIANVALIPDSLISLLDNTTDSALLRFKELLLTPENALLSQTVEILGFSADFPLKTKLAVLQVKRLTQGVFINIDNSCNANIKLLSNNVIRIEINKRYTVLGKFLKFKTGE